MGSAIKKLKTNKSPGVDKISAEEIQAAGQSGVAAIFELCNKIWENEQFPQMWKKAMIVPIHKKSDKLCCDNHHHHLFILQKLKYNI